MGGSLKNSIPAQAVMDMPELQCNPFRERICEVFGESTLQQQLQKQQQRDNDVIRPRSNSGSQQKAPTPKHGNQGSRDFGAPSTPSHLKQSSRDQGTPKHHRKTTSGAVAGAGGGLFSPSNQAQNAPAEDSVDVERKEKDGVDNKENKDKEDKDNKDKDKDSKADYNGDKDNKENKESARRSSKSDKEKAGSGEHQRRTSGSQQKTAKEKDKAKAAGEDDPNKRIWFSFTSFLQLMNAFSPRSSLQVKAFYAFKLFDFDGDRFINTEDLVKTLETMVGIGQMSKKKLLKVASEVLQEGDLDGNHKLSRTEFNRIIKRIPDFPSKFQFSID